MRTCATCGARSPADATWCSQCYVAFDPEPGPSPGPTLPVTPEPTADPFAHPEAMREPMNVHSSRWIKSETTMGPFGRVTTSLLLLVPLWLFLYAGVMGFVGMAMWVFIVMPAALRSIWRRAPVVDEGDTSELDP